MARFPAQGRGRGLGERPAADTRGAGCEAAACGRAHAVRLAHHRANRTDNPAVAVRGPKHVVKTGKTPVLEHAQEMAAHESPRTTKLYDRTRERLTQDEVERIRL